MCETAIYKSYLYARDTFPNVGSNFTDTCLVGQNPLVDKRGSKFTADAPKLFWVCTMPRLSRLLLALLAVVLVVLSAALTANSLG